MREIPYPTTAASLALGMKIIDPVFPDRRIIVEKVIKTEGGWPYIRFDNGNVGEVYPPDHLFTVVSDN